MRYDLVRLLSRGQVEAHNIVVIPSHCGCNGEAEGHTCCHKNPVIECFNINDVYPFPAILESIGWMQVIAFDIREYTCIVCKIRGFLVDVPATHAFRSRHFGYIPVCRLHSTYDYLLHDMQEYDHADPMGFDQ